MGRGLAAHRYTIAFLGRYPLSVRRIGGYPYLRPPIE
jgi:hypothetical protein